MRTHPRAGHALLAVAVFAVIAPLARGQSGGPRVEVSYDLRRIGRIASNQLAVWIEDERGRHVRTLFATDFTARRRGFRRRRQSLPLWVARAGVASWSPREIDAVSGPTQPPGPVSLTWDCTDAKGAPVPEGVYVYRVEGNLFWENTELWTGRITVGSRPDQSVAEVSYSPRGAETMGTLVSGARASFQP